MAPSLPSSSASALIAEIEARLNHQEAGDEIALLRRCLTALTAASEGTQEHRLEAELKLLDPEWPGTPDSVEGCFVSYRHVLKEIADTFWKGEGRDYNNDPLELLADYVNERDEQQEHRWREIASAPKDGTHILVCRNQPLFGPHWGFNQQPPTVAHWFDPGIEEQPEWAGFYVSVGADDDQPPFKATHWMPLPHPPLSPDPTTRREE